MSFNENAYDSWKLNPPEPKELNEKCSYCGFPVCEGEDVILSDITFKWEHSECEEEYLEEQEGSTDKSE